MSSINISYCDCEDTCSRWGIFTDGSGGYFAPYVPENISDDSNKCKKLNQFLGKNISPTKIERKDKENNDATP